ncbi:MAG: hypothetical protein A2V85_07320 [Chloroflexi bacterium RBG_16_72_14]|nr:MAG: hypothetical protein A2V85_07320 [Chloroflexi bacterium RBG_16_72_14]
MRPSSSSLAAPVPTIADVARRAGVGRSTASRVLNGSPHVDQATRDRVREAITALGFTPSQAARRLSLGRTWAVDIIVDLGSAESVERLRGAWAVLRGAGYEVILRHADSQGTGDQPLLRPPPRGGADGLLILSVPPDPAALDSLAAALVPVVAVDVVGGAARHLPTVSSDDIAGGATAGRFLSAIGHESLGFVGEAVDGASESAATRARLLGFADALSAAGARLHTEFGGQGAGSAHDLAVRLLSTRCPPTAVLAAGDIEALGVLAAARELGLRVPADLSVVGYGDLPPAKAVGLTTIRAQLPETGRTGAGMLVAEIGTPSPVPPSVCLVPELVLRATAAPPPGRRREPRQPAA